MNLRQCASGAALLVAAALPLLSHSQEYPSRPLLFVVPFTPGTTADSLARLVQVHLLATLGRFDRRGKPGGRRRRHRH